MAANPFGGEGEEDAVVVVVIVEAATGTSLSLLASSPSSLQPPQPPTDSEVAKLSQRLLGEVEEFDGFFSSPI